MKDVLFGLIRHGLTTFGGAMAAHGWIGANDVDVATGAIMALIGVAFSIGDKVLRAKAVTAILIGLIAASSLSACAGNTPWTNPQQYAGINRGHVQFDQAGKISDVDIWGGKENEKVAIVADLEKGTVTYSAEGAKAFDGQRARQVVEQAVSDDVKAVAPGITESIVSALVKAFGVP